MRIAMFHELDFGGAKRVVMEYGKRLKKNHIIDLYYVAENNDEDASDFFSKVYYYNFNSWAWKGNNWKVRLYKDTIELIKLYKLHKKIKEDILSRKYDCIFVHPSKYTQAPFLLSYIKNKCIYYCEEPLRVVYDPFISSNIKNTPFPKNLYELLNRRIRKWIDSKNCKYAKIILANSNFSKEFIEKTYGIRAEVCYLGVNASFFKPLNINKSIDVLFIGNKDKGYDLLNDSLKFFKITPKVQAIFRQNVKPSILDKELVRIYNKSKMLVALNQNEPFGLIPLESMACGTPVIAVNEGGYKESIISGKTGFLIERNSKNLVDAISKLLNNDKLRVGMGKEARIDVEKNWTWDKCVERFWEILENAK